MVWGRKIRLKDLDVFKITEEPEGDMLEYYPPTSRPVSGIEYLSESIESLKEETIKLGKMLVRARMAEDSEHKAIRSAISALPISNGNLGEEIINDLLSIADGLDAGIRANRAVSDPDIHQDVSGMESWLAGIEIVHQRVIELLEKLGVQPIHSLGKPFDPSQHVAIGVEHVQDVGDNIILEEHRRGYIRNGKVIRYAEVVVNKQLSASVVDMEESSE